MWNNESDAFKHAFLSAYLSLVNGKSYSKIVGDYHEYFEGYKDPRGEVNMDLWNNAIGREIAEITQIRLGNSFNKLSLQEKCDIVSEEIVKKMKNGELITTPKDKRSFKNMQYERLQDKDRIFYQDEYWNMDEKERRRYAEHYTNFRNNMNGRIPTKLELNAGVVTGDLIYVKDYKRADGVSVSGYYRHKPKY